MDSLGIHFGFLEMQAMILCAALPLILTIFTLFSLKKHKLTGVNLALWVLVICVTPYLGVFAYWMLKPWEAENLD